MLLRTTAHNHTDCKDDADHARSGTAPARHTTQSLTNAAVTQRYNADSCSTSCRPAQLQPGGAIGYFGPGSRIGEAAIPGPGIDEPEDFHTEDEGWSVDEREAQPEAPQYRHDEAAHDDDPTVGAEWIPRTQLDHLRHYASHRNDYCSQARYCATCWRPSTAGSQ